jgi:hypothetical protein
MENDFLKLTILESSLLENHMENDITYNARRFEAYIDTFLTMSTNCFSMQLCYGIPNSTSKNCQKNNIRNLAGGELKGRMIIKQSRTESKKGSNMKKNMIPNTRKKFSIYQKRSCNELNFFYNYFS